MPLLTPSTSAPRTAVQRLIELLEADTDIADLFTAPIREYPPDGVSQDEDVVLALYITDEDLTTETLGRSGVGKNRTEPRLLLTVMVHEAQGTADGTAPEDAYKRCYDVTDRVRQAIYKYRTDPSPPDGCPLWANIEFGRSPTTMFQRYSQAFHMSRTQLTLRIQRRNQ